MKEIELLLLQLIKHNGKIENLTKQGYEYTEIAKMINTLISEDVIEHTQQGFILTKKGISRVLSLNKELDNRNIDAIIRPQSEYRLERKKSIYDIYLPENF